MNTARLLESVDCGDVRMVQGRERFRFALKPVQAVGVRGECIRQDLDRDLTSEGGVRRPVHLPHAAFADRRGNFVDAEARAGAESQTAGSIAVSVAQTRSLLQNGVVVTDPFLGGVTLSSRPREWNAPSWRKASNLLNAL